MLNDTGLIARWRRATGDLMVLLLFGQMPTAIVHHLHSWRHAQTGVETTNEVALIAVIYSAFALLAALPVATITLALERRRPALAARLDAGYTHACLLLFLLLVNPMVCGWFARLLRVVTAVRDADDLPEHYRRMVLLAIVSLWALVVWRRGWVGAARAISQRLQSGYVPALAVALVAAVTVTISGHASIRPFGWSSSSPAQASAADAARPDIYLITVDTLAAQDMSLYGYRLPTTPRLERFSRRAHVFENFQANANWTQPTIASIMTGLYPDTHRCNPNNARLDPEVAERTLPALLRARGYVTEAITTNTWAHPLARGFGTAFDYVSEPLNEEPWRPLQGVLRLHQSYLIASAKWWWYMPFEPLMRLVSPYEQPRHNQHPAGPVIERTLRVVQDRPGPRFVWTHFFAPHLPYLPPPPFEKRFLASEEFVERDDFLHDAYDVRTEQAAVDRMRLRYDEFVAYADDAVGQLLDGLERQGVLDRSIVIISADHGESFSHGWATHQGPIMNQAVLHIPLLVHVPGQADGRRIATPGEEVDLLPTILDLAGLPVPGWAEGRSLVPVLQPGSEAAERPLYSYELTAASRFREADSGALAVVLGNHKLVHRIRSGCEDLYDLQADPEEKVNLITKQPQKAAELRGLLQQRRHSQLTVNPPADGRTCKLSFPEGA